MVGVRLQLWAQKPKNSALLQGIARLREFSDLEDWLRELDLNQRPSGYEHKRSLFKSLKLNNKLTVTIIMCEYLCD